MSVLFARTLLLIVPALLAFQTALAQGPTSPADFGDLPNPTTPGALIKYQTTIADGGPWHLIDPQIFIGGLVDQDPDGFPSNSAKGDDINGGADDEDGVMLPTTIKAGTSTNIQVKVTNQTTKVAYLHAFIDWNGDGAFIGGLESKVLTVPPGTAGANIVVSFAVPTGAITSIPVGARFRLSTLALDPNDPAPDGEVEDEMIQVAPPDLDFGDLPDSSVGASPAYATTLANDGARHAFSTDLFLGASAPDIELDGQPDLLALGDDSNGADDEEGFNPLSGIQAGTTVAFKQDVTNQKTNVVWLHGFFDWNHDGDFLDANETTKTAVAAMVTGLPVTLNVAIPLGIPYSSDIPSRLRLTSLEFIGPDGFAPDGEVEDYLLSVDPALDFGDLPDIASGSSAGDFIALTPDYLTTLADNGPRHLITPDLVFQNDTGSADADIDFESDAFQSADATGDDTNGDNDELRLQAAIVNQSVSSGGSPDCDDVVISATIILSHSIKNDFPVDATLHTFIDWNRDGDFQDANEVWSMPVPAGTNGAIQETVTTSFPWPGTLTWTEIYAVRSRLTTDNSATAIGYAPDGEIQDDLLSFTYSIANPCPTPPSYDFGDLPDSCFGSSSGSFDTGTTLPDYRTRLADNGPRHILSPDLTIANDSGSGDLDVDAETDGQPTASADGDDLDGNNDDLNLLTAVVRQTFNVATPIDHSTLTLEILADQAVNNTTGNDATFYGFIDGNRDGDFNDPGEKQTTIIPGDGSVPNSAFTFTVTIPWNGELSWNETFALRFRISSDNSLSAIGEAPDGEVQDSLVTIGISIDDPRPRGSSLPCVLTFDPIAASTGADLLLNPTPFLPTQVGPIHNVVWSLNGNFLSGDPPVITAQDLVELGQGSFRLTLTFEDQNDKLYRVDPMISLRDWPTYDLWALGQGLSGQSALPDSDPDEDGFSSRAEFAFGSDPLDDSSIPGPVIRTRTVDGETFLLQSYLRRAGGSPRPGGFYRADQINYSGQGSTALADWTTPAISTFNPLSLPAPPADYEWATHRFPTPISEQNEAFLRIKADCR